MNESSLPWLEPTWNELTRLPIERIPNSILISGFNGCGIERLAQSLTARLLCEQPKQGSACLTCKACKLCEAGTHPDYMLVEPDDVGKPLKVDQIRTCIDFALKTPQLKASQIIVIQPAEEMNLNAANALLKVLEEPTDNTFIILVTSKVDSLLPTIRSRLTKWHVDKPSEDQALNWLKAQVIDEQYKPEDLLAWADGLPLTAKSLMDDKWLTLRTELIGHLEGLCRGQASPIGIAESLAKKPVDQVLYWMVRWLTASFELQQGETWHPQVTVDVKKVISFTAKKSDKAALYDLYQKTAKHMQAVLGHQNLNSQLILEDILVGWQQVLVSS